MAEYRLHYFDRGGRISRSCVFEGQDDDDAIRCAWRKVGDCEMELWSLAGLVCKFSRHAGRRDLTAPVARARS
jgi:hypothetical protein